MGLAQSKLTLDAFIAWEQNQQERHEFDRGDIFAMAGGSFRHNRVVMNLGRRISDHLEGSGCQVFTENILVKLASSAVYPDVVVTCATAVAGDQLVVEDPRLVIEVLSPSTRGYDQRDKFALYRTAPTLREFVLVDPASRTVERFARAEAGAWLFTAATGDDALTLTSLELDLPLPLIFKGVEIPGT